VIPSDPAEAGPARRSGLRERFAGFRESWDTLSLYERFEQVIALTLTALIAVIVVMATWDLAKEVFYLAWKGLLDPLDPRTLQAIFGQIMILLIALEFKHSILKVVAHRESIAQVRTVLLIALLAITRKFIILDASQYSAATIVALATVVFALGSAYWLLRGSSTDRS
jgi:uncharacterized membrane protein (DUF373 family)